jgi:hypothetical protein
MVLLFLAPWRILSPNPAEKERFEEWVART